MSEPKEPHSSVAPSSPLLPGAERACAWVVGITVAVVLGIGLTNGLAWFDTTRPWTLMSGYSCMRFNAALGITTAALTLVASQFVHRHRAWKVAAFVLGLIPTVIGG